jgi:phosphatidylserine/phosphatidylglycerophosphate/cardiolipin synthase-like enzyme
MKDWQHSRIGSRSLEVVPKVGVFQMELQRTCDCAPHPFIEIAQNNPWSLQFAMADDLLLEHISGVCIGQQWVGYPDRGLEPWRDTGVEIEGPALGDIERAFARTWAVAGKALSSREHRFATPKPGTGDVAVRIIASAPNVGSVYRIDQLITMLASKSNGSMMHAKTAVADGMWARVGSVRRLKLT